MQKSLIKEEFIEKAKKVHGDKYDYSKANYVNNKSKIKILCNIHGVFDQIPNSHLNGRGCPKCGKIIKKIKQTSTNEIFISKSNLKYNFKYDYSLVEYRSKYDKVKIICPYHGVFLQTPHRHLNSITGCAQCGINQKSISKNRTTEDFIKKAKEIHKDLYDYSETVYHNDKSKIEVNCKKHGLFKVSPNNHLFKKSGCPKCKSIISKPEIEVQDFVKSLGFKIKTNDRKFLENTQELDILIHSHKVAIEFNGNWWHYDKSNPNCKPKGYHGNKSKLCKKKGYKLFHLREDLWKKNKEKMKKVIKKLLE